MIYWETKKYEKQVIKNQSTYWMVFELIWRDYFKYISMKYRDKIFSIEGILNRKYNWNNSKTKVYEWIDGKTKEDIFLTLKKKQARNLKVYLKYNGPVKAPVKKDQKIGQIEVFVKDELVKKVPIYASENVDKVNVFKSLFMSLNYLIWGDV